MKANQAEYPIRRLCELLGVSTSGYYAWLGRPESARTVADRALTESIVEYWKRSRRSYGAPRIHADLTDEGIRVGRKRVARLMRNAAIQGITRRKWIRTTIRDDKARPAPDLVQRRFSADAPNEIWVADITEIPTWEGPLYLAAVQDVWSRRIVGWALDTHMRTELVADALNMALGQRHAQGVVHHSDQGSQGGFNWWSQHLEMEVVDGGLQASAGAGDQGDAREDLVSGAAFDGEARAQSPVLGSGRSGRLERGCCGRGGHVLGGWSEVVPRGWWDAVSQVGPGVGPFPVVQRA